MKYSLFLSQLGMGICIVMTAWAAQATSLEQIRSRGTLVAGVKNDVPLWGYQDRASGKITGLEPDLAQLIADNLGVKLELVGVQTAERVDAVISGKVDVLIATLSDTPERQKQMSLVAPHYYSSGVNILARKSENFKEWKELRNRKICGRRGAFYNRLITVTYGADIVALYSNERSQSALRDGRCAALLYDDTGIIAMLNDPQWSRDFLMPLNTILPNPWSIALAPSERGGALEKAISKMIVSWHRDGVIRKLEKKWGIPGTKFIEEMNRRWSKKDGAKWLCGEEISESTPKECL
jgi:polar amino acid transport system substrate-binding protein